MGGAGVRDDIDDGKIGLALRLPIESQIRWQLARQIGIRRVVTNINPIASTAHPVSDFDTLQHAVRDFADGGFELIGLEGELPFMRRIKLGLPGRDEDIDTFNQLVRNMGRLSLQFLAYNFIAGPRAVRTTVSAEERGGALVGGYDHVVTGSAEPHPDGPLSHEQMWQHFEYFITRTAPVAEKAGVRLALHPNDPPVRSLNGIARIFTNTEAFHRAWEIAPSPANAVTLCLGTFASMCEDPAAVAREFGAKNRIAFVHFRDVRGDAHKFVETFPDNGPTDMRAVLKALWDSGYRGAIRPDHPPTLAGEEHDPHAAYSGAAGKGFGGTIFTVAYMRGLLEGLGHDVA